MRLSISANQESYWGGLNQLIKPIEVSFSSLYSEQVVGAIQQDCLKAKGSGLDRWPLVMQ